MSDDYSKLFQSAGSVIYENVSYYTNKLQDIFVEISKINETILTLRRRIIKAELDIQDNVIKYNKLKKDFDILKEKYDNLNKNT